MVSAAPSSDLLVLTLPSLPPTVNHAYYHRADGGKQRTPATAAWQDGAILAIRAAASGACRQNTPWDAAIHFQAPDVGRWDLDNRCKVLLDAVAAALGLDDRNLMSLQVVKTRAPVAQTTIRVQRAPERTV